MANGKFKLLESFRKTFEGRVYKHRDPTVGNKIGRYFFEDMLDHSVSARYTHHVASRLGVVSIHGKVQTPRDIRRNDSVFGIPPAGAVLREASGFRVIEGPVAEPRIGCEVKIVAKSQQKQIDRVINDLEGFARRMKRLNRRCINLAVVGVNHESDYVGHEGARSFRHALKAQESAKVEQKLRERLIDVYDELLLLSFRATNQPPYPFHWLNPIEVDVAYGAALTRVGAQYQSRFR
ncbi:MAG TPA: hypothetical protein VNL14_05580 [Candidatus Acidoferrales bacterium]|nr:hypothetical protein [Candidatus Acidoferrales bacterium]